VFDGLSGVITTELISEPTILTYGLFDTSIGGSTYIPRPTSITNLFVKDEPVIDCIASYNEVKSTHPNDWWVISDDDEFHVYPDSLRSIISNCDRNGWEMVRGGFIDRIGEDGEMVELLDTDDIFEKFPYAGFFRYPLSGANPNKICLVKGNIEITNGQHYAKIDGHTTWRWQGWNHPLIAPIKKISVQVHHFKWDSTCAGRIRHVANQNKDYSYSEEYRVMYRELAKYRFKLPLDDERFGFELSPTYHYLNYSKWKQLINKIISI
jgi:hypothetical protein